MSDEIRIYVADLTAYNNGKLHGVWINARGDINDIWEQIKAMLATSPEGFAEEYAIHDYEGFGAYALS
jgi:antirestriction protein